MQAQPTAGPSILRNGPLTLSVPLPHPPPLSASTNYGRAQQLPPLPPLPLSLPVKPQFMAAPLPPQSILPQPMASPRRSPKQPSFPNSFSPSTSFPPSTSFSPSTATLSSPIPSHPVGVIPSSSNVTPSPILESPNDVHYYPQPLIKKQIGRPPEDDPNSKHGTFSLPPRAPPPNPARTLVMELLPKKFRDVEFIRGWAASFGPVSSLHSQAPRVHLDIKAGRALIEFAGAERARMAWESTRMFGEGKEHIRVWWYRVPGVGAGSGVGELEEGEIEDGMLEDGDVAVKSVTRKPKKKVQQPKLVPRPPAAPPLPPRPVEKMVQPILPRTYPYPLALLAPPVFSIPDPPLPLLPPPSWSVPAPAREAAIRHPTPPTGPELNDRATSMDLASDDGFAEMLPEQSLHVNSEPCASADTASIASSRAGSVVPEDAPIHIDPTVVLARLSSPAVALVSDAPSVPAPRPAEPSNPSPVITSRELSPAPAISLVSSESPTLTASTSSRAATPSPPNRSAYSTPTPPPSEPRAMKNAPKGPSYVKRSLMARQRELEGKIARSREDLATRTASRSGTSTPTIEAHSEDTYFTRILDTKLGPPLVPTPPAQAVSDLATDKSAESLAKEEKLRRLVLNSKRPKMEVGSLAVHATTITSYTVEGRHSLETRSNVASELTQSAHSLEDLAVSFITETIQSMSPAQVVPPPEPTAPSPVPMTEKEILVAKEHLLQKHIADTKALIAKLGAATSKDEKKRLMKEMKESTR